MSTPAYDGKGQPPVAQGWFSGLSAWWNRLTPQYVSHALGGTSATPHRGIDPTTSTDSPGASADAPAKPAESSATRPAAIGAAPCTVTGAVTR